MKLTKELCEEFFSQESIEVQRAIILILSEYKVALEKHPKWPDDMIHRAAIVCEEAGELVQAALNHKYEKGQYYQMYNEAADVGATVIRFLAEAIDIPFKK